VQLQIAVHCSMARLRLCSQVDFLFDVFEDLRASEPASFLELACGPAQHSLEMAESKLNVFAVDVNSAMVEFAQQLADSDGLQVSLIEADMRDFKLPVRPCTLLNSC
jgi:ubiquinone/menaquinone biosynthesis C-methylase UbiE